MLETTTPTQTAYQLVGSLEEAKSNSFRQVAAIIVGMEISRDIFVASVLEKPARSAAVIVIPLLEVPGIRARH